MYEVHEITATDYFAVSKLVPTGDKFATREAAEDYATFLTLASVYEDDYTVEGADYGDADDYTYGEEYEVDGVSYIEVTAPAIYTAPREYRAVRVW